jgi:hydroxypyruvate isomerase
MIDTMHVHDNGENVAEIVRKYVAEIMELQLRDTNSRPPGQGEINFDPVLEIVRKRFKGLACLEYRPSSDPWTDFENALKTTKIIAEVR